ncbi:MAG: substrate-binding domain-containing protein [Thermomicrobiales bacterium]|nr:substrate-binding domain-containing protein [Thermomicrobiales bacterium]
MARPLFLFLPGAFGSMGSDIREGVAAALPGTELTFHEFMPSGMLAQEIRDGAPADLAVSANTRFMNELHDAGFVPKPAYLAGNRLCIIVNPDHAERITALADLTDPDVTLVTPQSQTDPCGQYVVQLFERAGLTTTMDAKRNAGTLMHSRGSGDLPGYLLDGRAQAGIFYHSETIALGNRVVTIELPTELDLRDQIQFTIGAVRRNGSLHPHAQQVVDWFLGPDGQQLLARHGFLPARALP